MRLPILLVLALLTAIGCARDERKAGQGSTQVDLSDPEQDPVFLHSDPTKVRRAHYSILFIGNSHTTRHHLADLVARMITFAQKGKSVYTHVVGVAYLEDAAADPRVAVEIDQRQWKHVVLQAQKISRSGKHHYSRQEGIDLAQRAKARGADVLYFAEWGRRGIEGDGEKQESVYQEMARASAARIAPVGRAWDLAMAQSPDLMLHDGDGNHQSALGAFLTACTLYATLTGEDPAQLAKFPYDHGSIADCKLLADTASLIFQSDAAAKKRLEGKGQ